jgi:hypothetical protein
MPATKKRDYYEVLSVSQPGNRFVISSPAMAGRNLSLTKLNQESRNSGNSAWVLFLLSSFPDSFFCCGFL